MLQKSLKELVITANRLLSLEEFNALNKLLLEVSINDTCLKSIAVLRTVSSHKRLISRYEEALDNTRITLTLAGSDPSIFLKDL